MSVPHARVNVPGTQKEFDIQTIVQYECFVGYEARGSPFAQCFYENNTALWSEPTLKCLRELFSPLSSPRSPPPPLHSLFITALVTLKISCVKLFTLLFLCTFHLNNNRFLWR